MVSGTSDLQRDLGGAIMQSVFGALLTAGYAAAVASAIAAAPNKAQITASTQNQLEKSFSSATALTHQYPQYASAITAGAKNLIPARRRLGLRRRRHCHRNRHCAGIFLFPPQGRRAATARRIPQSGLQAAQGQPGNSVPSRITSRRCCVIQPDQARALGA